MSFSEKYKKIPVQIKASFWFLVCSVMQRGISVITTPIFTRLLNTEEYGQVGVFNSWLDIVSVFVTLRLYYGVFVQGLVKYEEDKIKYASSMQGLGLTLSIIWTIVYFLFRNYWNELFKLTTTQMLAMMLMIWATGAFRFWAATKRNEFEYRALVIITIIVSVLKPLLGIYLVTHSEDKATARILAIAIVEIAAYSLLFFIQVIRGKQFYSKKYWKHALMFNIPLIPHYLSQTVLNSSDRIMIRNMVGVSEAGIYTLAYNVSKIMSMFNQALTQTLNPWIYQKIKAKQENEIGKMGCFSLLFVGGLNLALIAFAPEILSFFAPEAYHEAIWVIPPVALSVYFQFSYNLFACFEFYFEKTKFIMIASVGGAVLNIILNYVFINIFGYIAAGYTTLFCYMVYAISHYICMKRICSKIDYCKDIYDEKSILMISMAILTSGILLLVTYKNNVIRYIIICISIIIIIFKRRIILDYIKTLISTKRKNQVEL